MKFPAVLSGILLGSILTFSANAEAASSTAFEIQPPVTTQHRGVFNGKLFSYTADVEKTAIPDANGKPAADMVTIAYLRDGLHHLEKRPIIFFFNGGPGASSSPLHTALGPQRMVDTKDGRALAENPQSPLDVADLVFIDPVGTGFSRPRPGEDGQSFWSVTSDAASVAGFIQSWLRAHHREASPYYICGESYGTNRAAQIIAASPAIKTAGVILISLYAEPQDPNLLAALYFPSLAVTAAYHGKAAKGITPQVVFNEATAFAHTVYLPALAQGKALPPAEKQRIAGEMAKRLGLSADFILQKDLRLDPYDLMLNLLKAEGLRTGQSDSRITGTLAEYASKNPPFDDPSMFSLKPGSSTASILKNYLAHDLHFVTEESYKPLNMDTNSKWQFDGKDAMDRPAALIGTAMQQQPQLRLLWAGGLYDLRTPLDGGVYALQHAGIPEDRMTIVKLAAGHGVYEGDENLKTFTEALRRFILENP
jgi:carboxypeptidase C (cathepsin A)